MASNTLPGPIDLLREAWQLFKLRWKTVVGVYLAGIVLFAGIGLFLVLLFGLGAVSLFAFDQLNPTSLFIGGIVALAVIVVLAIVGTWWQGALLLAFVGSERKLNFSTCFREAKLFIVPLITTGLLAGFIMLGSYFVFFLPGLLFSIWFGFTQLVVVDQKTKNLQALQTSREYFRGRFFQVLWRMIAIYLPFFILGILLGAIGDNETSAQLQGLVNLASFVASPFLGMYGYVLYRHLRSMQPVAREVSTNSKLLYFGTAVVGYILMILLASALFTLGAAALSQYQQGIQRQRNSVEIPDEYTLPQEFDDQTI